jgi:hypothetical protein
MGEVRRERPPMWDEIVAAFPRAARPGVIFSWGSTIYYPFPLAPLTGALFAHEAVHGARQQQMGIETWWHRYIGDPAFRLEEEIPAHRAEYLAHCHEGARRGPKRAALTAIAKRLASPLYGGLVTLDQAKRLVA